MVVFAFVFCVSMAYSFECFASVKILIFSLIGVLLFVLCYKLLALLSERYKTLFNGFLVVFFLCFVFVTLFLNLTCRNNSYSIIDYGFVLDAAVEYAEIGEKFDSSYFSNFTVNAFLMLVLSGIIRFCRLIHIQDYYYVLAVIATLIESVTMLSCAFLAYKEKEKIHDAAMAMIAFACFLPMYALMPFLYNDMLTFSIITVVFSIIRMAYDTDKKWAYYLLNCLAGLVLGFGILIKFTIVIQVIALGIVLFIYRKPKKKLGIFVMMLVTCGTLLVGNAYVNSKEFVKIHSLTENPVSAWIATGMSEDGSFSAAYYNNFIKEMYTYETKEEKDAYSKEYIKNNYKVLFDFSHIIKKTKRAYGLSTFGASEYSIEAEAGYEDNLIVKCFNVYRGGYPVVLDIVSSYFGSILVIYILGIAYGIYLQIKNKQRPLLLEIAEISFVGYFLYLMISETSHHQIFNLMPLVILGTVLHINLLTENTEQGFKFGLKKFSL